MPTDSQPEGRDLRAEPTQEDEKAAVALAHDAIDRFGGLRPGFMGAFRLALAQAREAGRRERDAQTVAWLGEQVRKMVAEAVTRNECDDQAAWACAASEAIWRAIERGDHLAGEEKG